ncbi:uncharacterized protein KGF55_001497 [Candida pseudojiufengensis]|uniref:uncharacterized protein n=1 Tax=Candida pseudojiufengensis TaxID=497109 RepID=UPI002224B80D|nr:uncharacterized protein KGF55_001497 [Candida pseudojiufengensis]KAI5965277.1 hypothetical protein KGF55_001497 [Candida pseudojiufengensis]
MSSRSNKPVRQDYIAKIRYTNNLPPPPLNPKYIEYNTTNPISSKIEGEQLLSSLFRKENFQNLIERIDENLGLELNLINNHGFLDQDKLEVIGQLTNDDNSPINLHPKDRVLLRDAGIGKLKKSEPGVSFLRRTEYISERSVPKSSTNIEENKVNEKLKNNEEDQLDSEHQLKAVENTFTEAEKSMNDLTTIKHPKNKKLKAISTWPLLPDTSMMDNKLINMKFLGSASIKREQDVLKRKEGSKYDSLIQKQKQETSIFYPIKSEDGGEWISMFELSSPEQISKLYSNLNSIEPENPINLLDMEDETQQIYDFKYTKNYDMIYQTYNNPYGELAINFVPEEEESEIESSKSKFKKRKVAHYLPINGKIELRKHRASTNSEINKFIKERTFDEIKFKLREPTTNELNLMDKARSEFDPMEYDSE